jgi:outer membrane protein OmpA-like peptidoglycan-associated protein
MKFRVALLVASVLSAPTAVLAQPVTGPYVSLGAGLDYLIDQNIQTSSIYTGGVSKISTNVGGLVSGAVGYGLGNGIRIELQGDWGGDRVDVGVSTTSNYQQQYHGFVNVLYDFDGASFGFAGLNPYVGFGGGYGTSHFSNLNFQGVDGVGNPTFLHTTGTYSDFAVQGIAGVAFNIAAIPGLALTAEYRFTTMPQDSSYNTQFSDNGVTGRVKLKTDGQFSNEALIGVRYALFAPAPVAAAAAVETKAAAPLPPAVARTYLVFFDWDRADLTARARQIVAQAAAASTSTQTTRIEVNGYTDLSGTAAYNQRLSVRRAESVEAELVRDGVSRGEISIHGYGESNPLVQTAKGVREPQNRRVEIILK